MEKRAGEDQKGDSEYATGDSSARGSGLMSSCFYFPFFAFFLVLLVLWWFVINVVWLACELFFSVLLVNWYP
jgi:hypothetical protein